jgi:hypothetical protein
MTFHFLSFGSTAVPNHGIPFIRESLWNIVKNTASMVDKTESFMSLASTNGVLVHSPRLCMFAFWNLMADLE